MVTCPRCGEDKLVSEVTTAGKVDWYCEVCSHIWREKVNQWDHLNANAERVTCADCGIEYFMTHPRDRCMECEQKAAAHR